MIAVKVTQAQNLPLDLNSGIPSPTWYFYENLGQIIDNNDNHCPAIKYYTERSGQGIYFEDTAIHFVFSRPGPQENIDSVYRIDMKFQCPSLWEGYCGTLTAHDTSDDFLNYFLPHCGSNGITDIHGYKRTVYEDAFPNINAHFTSDEVGPVIYFEIEPYASPNMLFSFEGQDSISEVLNALVLYTAGSAFALPGGSAYQIDGSGNVTSLTWVPDWMNNGNNTASITLGSYDPSKRLILKISNPAAKVTSSIAGIGWAQFYDRGNNLPGEGARICTDAPESALPVPDVSIALYSCNKQSSSKFPVMPGGFQFNNNGSLDLYISKFDGGSARKWSTYYGGSADETCLGIAQSSSENSIYLVGTSLSPFSELTLPSGVSNQGVFSQTQGRGFIGRFNKFDGKPSWRTKIDGKDASSAFVVTPTAIDIDNKNNKMYVVGVIGAGGSLSTTQAANSFPLKSVSGRYNQSSVASGYKTGFLMEFDLTGTPSTTNDLLWSTVCGAGTEFFTVKKWYSDDPIFQILVGGKTTNSNTSIIPVMPQTGPAANNVVPLVQQSGAYFQSTMNGVEGLLLSFDFQHKLSWCTYWGGSGDESVSSIHAREAASIWVCGSTNTSTSNDADQSNNTGDFPVFTGYFRLSPVPAYGGGSSDDYLANFAASHVLNFSSYIGGTGNEGDPSITGATTSEIRPFIETDWKSRVVMAGTTQRPSTSGSASGFPLQTVASMYNQNDNSSSIDNDATAGRDAYFLIMSPFHQLEYGQYFGGSSKGNQVTSGCADEILTGLSLVGNQRIYSMLTTCTPNTPISDAALNTTSPWLEHQYFGGKDAFLMYLNYSDPQLLSAQNLKKVSSYFKLSALPNPSNGVTTLTFNSRRSANIQLGIVDVYGRLIKKETFKTAAGANLHRVDLSDLVSGMYFLTLDDQQQHETIKIIKL